MLTTFGKFLRKLRIDNGELLKDMSEKLNVTVAYLSAVENGKRDIPDKWLNIIKEEYNLSVQEFIKMQEAAYEEKNSINVSFGSGDDRSLVLSFAREFNELSNDDKQDLLNILQRKKRS